MKKLLASLLAVSFFLLGGCVAVPYDPGPPQHSRGYSHDNDRDGVPNRYDRAPNNPYYR